MCAYATTQNTRREDDDLDIDAIIEANKETLPKLPGAFIRLICLRYFGCDVAIVNELTDDFLFCTHARPRTPGTETPVGPLKTKMQGLKGNPADDEETRKGPGVCAVIDTYAYVYACFTYSRSLPPPPRATSIDLFSQPPYNTHDSPAERAAAGVAGRERRVDVGPVRLGRAAAPAGYVFVHGCALGHSCFFFGCDL